MDLDRKKEQRLRFLQRMYEVSDGNRLAARNIEELGKELGLTSEEAENVVQYLRERGWVEWRTMGHIGITQYGIEEVERALEAEKVQTGGRIPSPVIGEVAAAFDQAYTHAVLDTLFMRVGAPGDPPGGSKLVKVREWLQRIDADPEIDALPILGRLLQDYMEVQPPHHVKENEEALKEWWRPRQRIQEALVAHGLSYYPGGKILGGPLFGPSRSLEELIHACDLPAINAEFDRAYANVATDPPAAVTAACAILEATCRTYIVEEKLTLPADQSLHPLWKVVQGHLDLDPSQTQDADLKRVLGGLASIVDGVGAYRTHAGSAHGHGPQAATIEPRHGRLAVHAAHTVVTFILETWAARKS